MVSSVYGRLGLGAGSRLRYSLFRFRFRLFASHRHFEQQYSCFFAGSYSKYWPHLLFLHFRIWGKFIPLFQSTDLSAIFHHFAVFAQCTTKIANIFPVYLVYRLVRAVPHSVSTDFPSAPVALSKFFFHRLTSKGSSGP